MSCKYKYNNQWYTKEDIFNLLLKERNINSKGELIKPVISNSKLSKKFEVVDDWNINDDGSSKLIKRFNTKEEANEYIKNIQEFHEAAGFKYGVIETLFANNGIEPRITNKTLKESIENVKNKLGISNPNIFGHEEFNIGNIVTVEGLDGEYRIYEYEDSEGELGVGTTEIFFNIEPVDESTIFDPETNPEGTGRPYFRVPTSKMKRVGLVKKEYTSQALINIKIAALKEVAKKYPRSLIRSEVKPIFGAFTGETFIPFDKDELPFQKISKEKQIEMLYLKSLEISDKTIEERIKQCE